MDLKSTILHASDDHGLDDVSAKGPKNRSSTMRNDSYFKVQYENIVDRIGNEVFLPCLKCPFCL